MVALFHGLERGLQRGFRVLGEAVARRHRLALAGVVAGYVLLSLGLLLAGRVTETDVMKLWVHTGTRVVDEMAFANENFNKTRVSSFVVAPRRGRRHPRSVLSPEVLRDVEALHGWVRDFEYTFERHDPGLPPLTVRLENFCRRGLHEDPSQPCFFYSVLDCFQEGRQLVHGLANNTVYYDTYGPRQSFEDPAFRDGVTLEYLQTQCMQWLNVATNWKVSDRAAMARLGRSSRSGARCALGLVPAAGGVGRPPIPQEPAATPACWPCTTAAATSRPPSEPAGSAALSPSRWD